MKRVLTPEWIDLLPPDDPRIARSRRDLLRLNRLNRSPELMARLLRQVAAGAPPQTLTDLGSGDGLFCLEVARRLHSAWPKVTVRLLDQQPQISAATVNAFAQFGWVATTVAADLFVPPDCLAASGRHFIMTNLVLHHFSAAQLTELFRRLAADVNGVVALEPRRGRLQLFFSRCLFLMGCGVASRHDGPASVRAGFRGAELTALWPPQPEWTLTESDPGPFSHAFVAQRRG